jgi:hypothetical protein
LHVENRARRQAPHSHADYRHDVQRAHVERKRGGCAERDHVGQGVEVGAERVLVAGAAGCRAVEHIEDCGQGD